MTNDGEELQMNEELTKDYSQKEQQNSTQNMNRNHEWNLMERNYKWNLMEEKINNQNRNKWKKQMTKIRKNKIEELIIIHLNLEINKGIESRLNPTKEINRYKEEEAIKQLKYKKMIQNRLGKNLWNTK